MHFDKGNNSVRHTINEVIDVSNGYFLPYVAQSNFQLTKSARRIYQTSQSLNIMKLLSKHSDNGEICFMKFVCTFAVLPLLCTHHKSPQADHSQKHFLQYSHHRTFHY